MFKQINCWISTKNDLTALIIRLTLGIVIFPHGAKKVLAWFDGPGFNSSMEALTGMFNLPWIIAFLVILIEFAGAICLILGFATRFWAIANVVIFIGMIITVHNDSWFMNWSGKLSKEGFEYHLLIIGLALGCFSTGGGKFSIDRELTKRMKLVSN